MLGPVSLLSIKPRTDRTASPGSCIRIGSRVRELASPRRFPHHRGYSQIEVARFLSINVRSARRWVSDHRREGDLGLDASIAPGRAPGLTPEQGQLVLGWLAKSPAEFGFAIELWTAPRIAKLIKEHFAVAHRLRNLNEWFTARGVTPQKSGRVPRERDQAEIDR